MKKTWHIIGAIIWVLALTANISWAATVTRNDVHATLIPATITVDQPANGTVINTDQRHSFPIQWKFSGYKDGKKLDGQAVEISLWQNNLRVGIIVAGISIGTTPNGGNTGAGNYTWDFAAHPPKDGQYQIRLKCIPYPEISVQSVSFPITSNPKIKNTPPSPVPPLTQNSGIRPVTPSAPGQISNLSDKFETVPKLVSLQVTTPSGGENWQAGAKHDIAFSYTNLTGKVTIIAHNLGNPLYDQTLTNDLMLNNSPGENHADYLWNIPKGTPEGDYQITVASNSTPTLKRVIGKFHITEFLAKITIQRPTADDQVHMAFRESFRIEWQFDGSKNGQPLAGYFTVSLFKSLGGHPGPQAVKVLGDSQYYGGSGLGHFDWDLTTDDQPVKEDGKYQIVVQSKSDGSIRAESPPFTVIAKTQWNYPEPFHVTAPAWGENWRAGSTHGIKFDYAYYTEPVTLTAHKVGGEPYDKVINDHFPLNGSGKAVCDWNIPAQAPPGEYQIVIFLNSDPNTIKSVSNVFNIVPQTDALLNNANTLSMLQAALPAGGEKWRAGTQHDIAFSYANITGSVKITARRATASPGGSPEIPIAGALTLDGSGKGLCGDWTIPAQTPAGDFQIVITSNSTPSVRAVSNSFEITPFLQVTTPAGGEKWLTGAQHNIGVNCAANSGTFKVTAHKLTGAPYDLNLFSDVTLGSSDNNLMIWHISNQMPSGDYQIVVINNSNPEIKGSSPSFNIRNTTPVIKVTAPAGGEQWLVGTKNNLAFSYANVAGTVKITAHRVGSGSNDDLVITNGWPLVGDTGDALCDFWNIPDNTPDGDYQIVITSNDHPNIQGVSNTFTIGGGEILREARQLL